RARRRLRDRNLERARRRRSGSGCWRGRRHGGWRRLHVDVRRRHARRARTVFPLESRTAIDSVCVPLATFVVSIGIDTGPLPPVCVPSDVPSIVTVNVLLPLEPFTHTTAHEVPLSVAADPG